MADKRLTEAEACYRRVLAAHPDHADALHLLGVIAHQVGRRDLAVELIGQAINMSRTPFEMRSTQLIAFDFAGVS